QLETGETVTLPVRNANVTEALGAEVDCENGIGKISSVYVTNKVDCGCDEAEVEPRQGIAPREDVISGEDVNFDAQKDVVAPKENVEVDMQDPYAKGTAIKSGKGSEYSVDVETVNGKARRFENGALHVWDKDGNTVTEEGYENIRAKGMKGVQIELHAPSDVTQIVEKLPETPTDVVNGEDGSITYKYEFEKGKDITVVLDAPKEGETERVGHFFIGDDEIVIDKKSAEMLMGKMSENTNLEFTSTDGMEQSVLDRIELSKRIQQRVEEYYTKRADAMENPVAPAENADFITPKTTTEAVTLSAEQKTQIMSNDTEMTCVGIKDGKAILEVKGVDGVSRIAVATPTHVDYNLEAHRPEATVGEDGSYSVAITTADEKQMVVNIANGKASTTLDGKPVVLDSESSVTTQNLVKMALRQKNVNMNIDLHTDFTEKVVRAVENATVSSEAPKTMPQVATQSGGR
ncbi:MAG: hypothetical protein IKA30_01905, partial [Alphaproteobacteria bacterium]|nr:hypothetical protein [Alphaproteobacteria bacterium]